MSRTTRREFARTLTALSAALPAAAALGQATTPAPPPTTARAAEEKKPATPPPPLAIALAGVVSAQSGQYLNEEEMQRIYDDFKDYVPFVERFRQFELRNGDEPDFTFHSLVDRW